MKALRFLAAMALAAGPAAWAQPSEVSIQTPPPARFIGRFLAPFHLEKRTVAPVKLANTPRLEQLVRSGNLYLSAQDVIALALENNLDIAVQRYGPFLSREVLMRAQAGGLLRATDTPVAPGPTSVSTAGVSTASSGLAGGAGIGSGGGIVTGIGPNPPNLDPSIVAQVQFAPHHHAADQYPVERHHHAGEQQPVSGLRVHQSWITGTSASVHVLRRPQPAEQQHAAIQSLAHRVSGLLRDPAAVCKASAWRSTTATSRWPRTT